MRIDNSLDLISELNKLIPKLNKSSQKGGTIKKLQKYKLKKLTFLTSGQKKQLDTILDSLIANGGDGKKVKKLSYNSLEKTRTKSKKLFKENNSGVKEVDMHGNLSSELESIIGGSQKYTQSDDIKAILEMANKANLINTKYIDSMLGGSVEGAESSDDYNFPDKGLAKAVASANPDALVADALGSAGGLAKAVASANPDALVADALGSAGGLAKAVASANPDALVADALGSAGGLAKAVASANPDALVADALGSAGGLAKAVASANPDALVRGCSWISGWSG